MSVRVQQEDFDVGREIAQLRASTRGVGAVASFVGVVRDLNDAAQIRTLTLEHYPGMTEKALERIVVEARQRWDVYDILVIHRGPHPREIESYAGLGGRGSGGQEQRSDGRARPARQ